MSGPYTTQLGAGLGLVDETNTLLELWTPGMSANQLNQVALEKGRFPPGGHPNSPICGHLKIPQ